MRKIFILLLVIVLAGVGAANAQLKTIGLPYIKQYTSDDYQVGNQNWDVIQDARGVMYFANRDGILQFDGLNWNNIKVSSNSSVQSLALDDATQRIYVGADGEFGYLRLDTVGGLKYESLLSKVHERQRVSVGKIYSIAISPSQGVVFQSLQNLYILRGDSIVVKAAEKSFKSLFTVGGNIYTVSTGHGILQLKDLVFDKVTALSIAGDDVKFMESVGDSTVLVSNACGIAIYKPGSCYLLQKPINDIMRGYLNCVTRLHDGSYAFGVGKQGVIITDSQFNIVRSGLLGGFVTSIYEDCNNMLWLTTNGSGVAAVDVFSPFSKFYNSQTKISGSIKSIIRQGSSLYIGTDALYCINADSLGSNPVFKELKNPARTGSIYELDTVNGELVAGSNAALFSVRNGQVSNISTDRLARTFKTVRNNPEIMLVGTAGGFFVCDYKNGRWQYRQGVKGDYTLSTRHFEEDENGDIWVSEKSKGIFRLKFNSDYDSVVSVSEYNSAKGLPSNVDNYIFRTDRELVVGTVDGFYKYLPDSDKFFPYENMTKAFGGNHLCDFMYVDSAKNIWVKKVRVSKTDENNRFWFLQRYKYTGDTVAECLKEPFFPFMNHIYSFGYIGDSCYVIGDQDGFVHYDERIKKDFKYSYNALVCNVENIYNDSVIVGSNHPSGNVVVLPYSMHGIRISYSAAFYEYPEMLRFKTFLENNDDSWSDFRNETVKEYSNLSPGTYTFHVIARNCYGQQSEEATITFKILAPWYLTWFAILFYVLIVAGLIWLIVKAYTKKLIRDKQKLELIVEERTSEIREQSKLIVLKNQEIMEKNQSITDSIKYAWLIQMAMLPLKEKIDNALPVNFILFRPKDIVSGDYYWFAETDKKIIITAADCTGHGVPGAFMSMIGSQILTEIVSEGITAADEILTNQNQRIRKALKQDTTENHDGMDMALCSIDKETKIVEYAGAKNPLIYIQNDEITTIKADKQAIGGDQIEENFHFKKHEVQADGNTWFYMFSDGYEDQFGGPDQKKFKIKNLRELIFKIHNEPPETQREILNTTIEDWIGKDGEQTDDIILMGFRL